MLGLVVGLGIDSLGTISLYQCAHSITQCRKNLHFHYLNRLRAIVTVLNTKEHRFCILLLMSPILSYTGVDVVRDDGVYTASLLAFQKEGFNSVNVRATANGVNETRLVVGGGNQAFQLFSVNGSK